MKLVIENAGESKRLVKAAMKRPGKNRYDTAGAITDYEAGKLSHSETVELFQHLVDTGLVWQLQGSYGRTAVSLFETGEVLP